MTDNTLPEVGSRWDCNGKIQTVVGLVKRGRGWQVVLDDGTGEVKARLADFRKQAKPA